MRILLFLCLITLMSCGGSNSSTPTLPAANKTPTATAGADQVTNKLSLVTLSGTSSSDSDGTIASYRWVQISGSPTVTLSTPNSATSGFTAPDVSTTTTFSFQLTVTDNQNATASDTISITVTSINIPPTVTASKDQSVLSGVSVTLMATASDTDGTISSYTWRQLSGSPTITLNSTTRSVTFQAPNVLFASSFTFEVSVTDNDNVTSTDSVVVAVRPISRALLGPLVNANVYAYAANNPNVLIESTSTTSMVGNNIDNAGNFSLTLDNLPDDEWILVVVSGGQDIDADDNGQIDATPTVNAGQLRAIAQTADWRKGINITVLTELVVQRVASATTSTQVVSLNESLSLIGKLTSSEIMVLANSATFEIISADTDGDSIVTYKDSLLYFPSHNTPTVRVRGGQPITLAQHFDTQTLSSLTVSIESNNVTQTFSSLSQIFSNLIDLTIFDTTPPTVDFGSTSISITSGQTTSVSLNIIDNISVFNQNIVCTNGGDFINGFFIAPTVTTDTIVVCTTSVTDVAGNTATDSLTVTISPTSITFPTVTFSSVTATIPSGSTISLPLTIGSDQGVKSQNISCTNSGSYANDTFTAPTVTTDTIVICTASVTDTSDQTTAATLTVTVTPPISLLEVKFSSKTGSTTSNGTLFSPLIILNIGSSITSQSVTCTNNGTYANGSFTAPTVTTTTTIICTASATNSVGSTVTDILTVTVVPVLVDAPPTVVFASKTASTTSGGILSIRLTISDDKGITSQGVTCSNGGSFASNSFTAPTVTTATTVICTASATDNAGNTSMDTLTVTVTSLTTTPTTKTPSVTVSSRLVLNNVDIIYDSYPTGTVTSYKIEDTSIPPKQVSGTTTTTAPSHTVRAIDLSTLADGNLDITFTLPDGTPGISSIQKNARKDKRVAFFIFHSSNSTPSFTVSDITARIKNTTNKLNASSILESISLGQERFTTVDGFGPFAINSATFTNIIQTGMGPDAWSANSSVIAENSAGRFNPSNYDIFYAIYDTDKSMIKGNTDNRLNTITINGVDYGQASSIGIYGNSSTLFANQCFRPVENGSTLSGCINNAQGEFFANIDSTLVHEYIHTRGVAKHTTLLSCDGSDDSLDGICTAIFFDNYDVMGSSRVYANSINPYTRYYAGWSKTDSIMVVDAIPPGSSNTKSIAITLRPSNSQQGHNSVLINYAGYADSNIWIQNLNPDNINYALSNSIFNNSISGLIFYENDNLLDATPPSATFEPNSLDPTRASLLAITQRNIARTVDGTISRALGIRVTNILRNTIDGSISFNLDLSAIVPTRRIPRLANSTLPCANGCNISSGQSIMREYYFNSKDIGYTTDTSWTMEFANLPSTVTAQSTSVSLTQGGVSSADPFSIVTYTISSSVSSGSVVNFQIKVCNSNDSSKCINLKQQLNVN